MQRIHRSLCPAVAVALFLASAAPANADPDGARYDAVTVAHTRDVLAAHAEYGQGRTDKAILRIAGGIAMGALGYLAYAGSDPGGGFVDMSGLGRMAGISLAVSGAFLIGTTPAYLMESTPQAEINADFVRRVSAGDPDGAVRMARARVREAASANRHLHHVMEGVMGGVFAGSLATAIIGYKMHKSDGDAGELLLGAGGVAAELGGIMLIKYTGDTDVEQMNARLNAPTMTAGLVPTRGGAIAGMSMSF